MQRRVPDKTLAQRHFRQGLLLAVLHGHLHLEHLGRLVEKKQAERAVVDDALGELDDPGEQLVEVEDGGNLAADFRQQFERVGVLALAREEARVDQRAGDVRRELGEDRRVPLGVPVVDAAQDVQGANRLVLVDERHGHRGRHPRHDLEVVRLGSDVADDQRLLRRDHPADQSLRDLELEARHVRVADGVRDAQLCALLVEEVHGERVELDQAADQVRNPLQQFPEVEDGRHLPAQIEQRQQDVPLAQV